MAQRNFPAFDLARLLRTVFDPKPGDRIGILIDLPDPREVVGGRFLTRPELTIQRYAHDVFHLGLRDRVMAELGLKGGGLFAYKITGGSNLDLPDQAFSVDGPEVSLEREVYPSFDILLCVGLPKRFLR
jgi:hypothetical protein